MLFPPAPLRSRLQLLALWARPPRRRVAPWARGGPVRVLWVSNGGLGAAVAAPPAAAVMPAASCCGTR
eukprot:4846525-Alexandrium_andersonii.AAC.1